MTKSALELLETAIIDLECRLGLKPGEESPGLTAAAAKLSKQPNDGRTKGAEKNKAQATKEKKANATATPPEAAEEDQPEICKLEFKVGVITKVWYHPEGK